VIHSLRVSLQETRGAERKVAADLRGMTKLNQLSNEYVPEGAEIESSLEAVVDTAIVIANAQKGAVQLVEPSDAVLKIAAHRGLKDPFLKFFEQVQGDFAASAAVAMRTGVRVIVEDVLINEIFADRAIH
jgi:GAF domain-containing protein